MHGLPARLGPAAVARARLAVLGDAVADGSGDAVAAGSGGPVAAGSGGPVAAGSGDAGQPEGEADPPGARPPNGYRADGGRHRHLGSAAADRHGVTGRGWVPGVPPNPLGRPERPAPTGPAGPGDDAEGPAPEHAPRWADDRDDPDDLDDLEDLAGPGVATRPAREPPEPTQAARLLRRGPWGALAQRWVPEPLRQARVDPGRRGAAVLSVVAALAALAAAIGVWWGRPEPRPVTPVALAQVTASAAGPSAAAPSRVGGSPAGRSAASPPGTSKRLGTTPASGTPAPSSRAGPMMVSVTGKVRRPGVVTVPAGSRVADAIAAAGGALDAADLTGLNLAARLSDGDSVVVAGPAGSSLDLVAGGHGAAPATAPPPGMPGALSGPIDINTADAAALERLPGVGPVTAAAIVAWRTEHGPFTDVAQLQAVSGIGPAKYAQISPHVTV